MEVHNGVLVSPDRGVKTTLQDRVVQDLIRNFGLKLPDTGRLQIGFKLCFPVVGINFEISEASQRVIEYILQGNNLAFMDYFRNVRTILTNCGIRGLGGIVSHAWNDCFMGARSVCMDVNGQTVCVGISQIHSLV